MLQIYDNFFKPPIFFQYLTVIYHLLPVLFWHDDNRSSRFFIPNILSFQIKALFLQSQLQNDSQTKKLREHERD